MQKDHFALTAISPLDGRYYSQLTSIARIFSEYSLIAHRVKVEVEYLLFLAQENVIQPLTPKQCQKLQAIANEFDESAAIRIKEIEKTCHHDVKAVEYYLREMCTQQAIPVSEYIHIALTSEDTNSIALALMVKQAKNEVIVPQLEKVLDTLAKLAEEERDTVMLGRTHGQPAIPTTVGKEVIVFAMRLLPELRELKKLVFEAKMSGAVGNFTAHQVAFPKHDWKRLSQKFITSLGLSPNHFTTQSIPAETYTRFFGSLQRIHGILLDLSQDMWRYISDDYFSQTLTENQVGSSTMPQKINPIDFENCEGNLGLANALAAFFVQKLPVSRMQRDLSDSTVKRNFGVMLGHCLLAYQSLLKGLGKIHVNQPVLAQSLTQHPEVVTEGIQVILRTTGDPESYEKLKLFSQGKKVTPADLQEFIESLAIDSDSKERLLQLTSDTYVGLAAQLVDDGLSQITTYLREGNTS